jgi:hypothetical protein
MAILAVSPLPRLAELRRSPIPPVRLRQIQTNQLRAIQRIRFSSEQAGDTTGDHRENLHAGGYCEISAIRTSNCSQVVHKTVKSFDARPFALQSFRSREKGG